AAAVNDAESSARAAAVYRAASEEAARRHEQSRRHLLTEPELQNLFRERETARLRKDYRLLARQLGLTDDETGRLINALVDHRVFTQDLEAMIRLHGLERGDPSLDALREEARVKFVAAVEGVLGPEATKVLRDYDKWERGRRHVATVGGLLARLGHALTLEQAEALARTVGNFGSQTLATQWREIEGPAEQILTAKQFEIFSSTTLPLGDSRWSREAEELLLAVAGPDPARAPARPPVASKRAD
ncbi:MAG TPA: hypothetical protein VHF69_03185, partial [Candidatus Synoicihabitans sp.]|nr:hypothetical protein [Candidatus Synoicihabitans sp.]